MITMAKNENVYCCDVIVICIEKQINKYWIYIDETNIGTKIYIFKLKYDSFVYYTHSLVAEM